MKTTLRISLLLLAVVISLGSFSCSTAPVCVTSSSAPIYGKMAAQNLGKTEGSSSTWSFLGLWMVGRPDIGAALDEAVRRKGGDALVNVRCYETWRWFVLFSTTTVYVEGEAVRITGER